MRKQGGIGGITVDNSKSQDNEVKHESAQRFPCPSCGGNMVFNPDTQGLFCPYCNSKSDIVNDNEDIKEYDFEAAEDEALKDWGEEKRVIKCESCGAETVLSQNSTADFCSFCGSSYIVNTEQTAGIAPESLVPFKISREKALGNFKAWINKRFFAPNDLKREYKGQRLTGMYIPFWTYDSDTYSTYTGEGGTYYFVTVTDWVEENGQRKMVTRQERRIRWWPTSGVYTHYFDDVLVNASKQIDNRLMSALEPYNLQELEPYKPEYLSGFLAERYSINLKEGWGRAAGEIDSSIRVGVERQINADEVRNLSIRTSYRNVRYKHLLLPVWISSYNYKNKVYRYMVNGQTGEVQGHAPVSPWKVAILILIIAAIAGVIFFTVKDQNQAVSLVTGLLT